jgi:hypothetical protein
MILNGDTTRLIWAYHENDPYSDQALMYHGSSSRGVRSVYLQEWPQAEILQSDNPKIWDLISQVTLPNNDHTHYWCQIFKVFLKSTFVEPVLLSNFC